MKFGLRTPSPKKSLAARMSVKKKIAPRMPRGMGILHDPEKAVYNKIYNKTTVSIWDLAKPSKKRGAKEESGEAGNMQDAAATPGSALGGFVILFVFIAAILMLVKFAC